MRNEVHVGARAPESRCHLRCRRPGRGWPAATGSDDQIVAIHCAGAFLSRSESAIYPFSAGRAKHGA
jgi:hypothetical protein